MQTNSSDQPGQMHLLLRTNHRWKKIRVAGAKRGKMHGNKYKVTNSPS